MNGRKDHDRVTVKGDGEVGNELKTAEVGEGDEDHGADQRRRAKFFWQQSVSAKAISERHLQMAVRLKASPRKSSSKIEPRCEKTKQGESKHDFNEYQTKL